MIRFNSDYLEGAHPRILEQLASTNMAQTPGYGEDMFCDKARNTIRRLCAAPNADVHFLVGGTQTNATVLAAMLLPYQGVISADTGHIAVHETGAIEAGGHKVIALKNTNGKLDAGQVSECCRLHFSDESHEHMVMPAAVYISNPTEVGTLYSRDELSALRAVCDQWKLTLFMDGARLGYGLTSDETDVTLPDIAALCDAFYIGGTKVGALCGEAVVFPRHGAPKRFITHIKQHGAMVAKGRLIGVQFDALFTDNLYFDISRHAIDMAKKLKQGFAERGFQFFIDSPTNQQFVIVPNEILSRLEPNVRYSYWQKYDDTHSVVRFAISWATPPENIDALMALLDEALA